MHSASRTAYNASISLPEPLAGSRAGSRRFFAGVLTIAGTLGTVACEEKSQQAVGMTPEAMVALSANASLPDSLLAGRAVFETYCRECHGEAATGSVLPGASPGSPRPPLGVRGHAAGRGDHPRRGGHDRRLRTLAAAEGRDLVISLAGNDPAGDRTRGGSKVRGSLGASRRIWLEALDQAAQKLEREYDGDLSQRNLRSEVMGSGRFYALEYRTVSHRAGAAFGGVAERLMHRS
jgi:mono/diheme cytochrome c family protein